MSEPNWLGLLQWSLAYTDGTTPSTGNTLSKEDREWLERVMKEGVRDEPSRLNEIMLDLKTRLNAGPTEDDEESFEIGLEDIKGIVDQIDMAKVFAKFGGAAVLLKIIDCASLSVEIRALAASVVGTMAQNNLSVQDMLFRDEVLVALMKTYAASDSPLLRAKLLYAASCMVRSHAAAELFFVNQLAGPVLGSALESGYEPLVLRAAFLSNALIASDGATHDRIARLADILLPGLLGHLNSPNVDLHDTVAALLTTLLHTERGWALLTTTDAAEMQAMLAARRAYIAASSSSAKSGADSTGDASEPLSSEDAAHFTHIVQRLTALAAQPVIVRHPHPEVVAALNAPPAVQVTGDVGGSTISPDDLRNWQIR